MMRADFVGSRIENIGSRLDDLIKPIVIDGIDLSVFRAAPIQWSYASPQPVEKGPEGPYQWAKY